MITVECVGDVVTQAFAKLGSQIGLGKVQLIHHGIDQHFSVLLSKSAPDFLISHARADMFLDGASPAQALEKMDDYVQAATRFADQGRSNVVLNTVLPSVTRMVGMDHVTKLRLVSALNGRLFDAAEASPFISIADLAGVVLRHGAEKAFNLQNDFVMRMPYTRFVLPEIVGEYARAIRERRAVRKKVLLLDADNTLWGGVVGEDGVTGILVDDQFPGIVYRKFQNQLLRARASGLLLALVTKNNEADVREAFTERQMPLSWDSFASVRANWLPKSQNISDIANELNVGLDSMVFIDDNAFELEEVKTAHPMVDCQKFDGRNPQSALTLLHSIPDLNTWSVTDEDRNKSEQYKQEASRKDAAKKIGSIDDYIASLGIRIEAGINRSAHIKRIAQLTNKTNQFNLTTNRYSEAELLACMEAGQVFDFRVTDKFGDMGIVGIAIIQNGEIETFLMSCRALGRKVEQTMLGYLCNKAGSQKLRARFVRSAKNAMVEDFYSANGFALVSEDGDTRHYEMHRQGSPAIFRNLEEVS